MPTFCCPCGKKPYCSNENKCPIMELEVYEMNKNEIKNDKLIYHIQSSLCQKPVLCHFC